MGGLVFNNTALVALRAIGKLDLVGALQGEKRCPPGVREEFGQSPGKPNLPEWIRVESPAAGYLARHPQLAGLGRGEREGIALAIEVGAAFVSDDLTARKKARALGLSVTGTLGLLSRMYEICFFERVDFERSVSTLGTSGVLWVTDELKRAALQVQKPGRDQT